jgi:NTE family protein
LGRAEVAPESKPTRRAASPSRQQIDQATLGSWLSLRTIEAGDDSGLFRLERLSMRLGLALSGGGFRAGIFHLGLLLRLADQDLLEEVSGLSTVSGGSLAVSLIMTRSGMCWPGSKDFREKVFPEARRVFTNVDLLTLGVGLRGALRYRSKLVTDRAAVLADSLTRNWGVTSTLYQLPDNPVWWINTTSLETGKNWRFSKREMGDWQFGRHYNPRFRLSDAAAASAGVPYAIGALKFHLPSDGWFKTDPATGRPLARIARPTPTVRLWDGGAYENLGLEAFYKPSEALRSCDFLICSDASGPLQAPQSPLAKMTALMRGDLATPRLFDIASDQIRALRSRMFMGDVAEGRVRGALLRMGNSVREIHIKAGVGVGESASYDGYLSDQDVKRAFSFPTGLKAVSPMMFDLIVRHGYELADAVLTTYSPATFQQSMRWAA